MEGSNEISNAHQGIAAHLAAAANGPFSSSFPGVQNTTQFPFRVDPSVMMMNNAAATIAAVAASAVQQLNQSKTHQSGGAGAQGAAPFALQLLSSQGGSRGSGGGNSSLNSQVAALLGAAAGGQSTLAFPLNTQSGSNNGASHQGLANNGESSSVQAMTGSFPRSFGTHSSTTMSSSSMANVLLPSMQTWSIDQLEQHVKLLHQMNQPVPQSVALLLADARRKQDKRMTKRLANRKSACTSRARKKTLVDEMTKTNARLRRQAMILALLPDLVIAINLEGDITFCSAQVERVLRHNTDDLIGAKLHQLLVPASRGALDSLIKELVKADKKESQATPRGSKRRRADQQNSSDTMSASKTTEDNGNGGSSRSGVRSGVDASAAAVVSVQSFPLSVQVRVNKLNENNVNSDGSTSNGGGKQPAVSFNSTALSRSPTASSSGEDEGARAERAAKSKRLSSSDESSSLSSEVKNMRNANQNLDRNVRWHNQKMMKMHGAKDDVTGASVTANNATARLSSLQHVPAVINKRKEDSASRYENTGDQSSSDDSLLAGVEEKKKGEHASDDSGYRESNDSREETSSSGSDTFNSKDQRNTPVAPAFRMCLIRDDLTTLWCEVTSSIRTRTFDEEPSDTLSQMSPTGESGTASPIEGMVPQVEVKELLLCLRPIGDGEKKVDESLRFVSPVKFEGGNGEASPSSPGPAADTMVSSSSAEHNDNMLSSKDASKSNSATTRANRPPKKRPPRPQDDSDGSTDHEDPTPAKRSRSSKFDGRGSTNAVGADQSGVESLMLMNKNRSKGHISFC